MTTVEPSLNPLCARLKSIIYYSLDNHLYRNAIFLAERLLAYEPTNDQNIHLLAKTYYSSGQQSSALSILEGVQSPACVYLFARCCLDLDKLHEGETALLGLLESDAALPKAADQTEERFDLRRTEVPDEAAISYLLGQICKKAQKTEQAAIYFSRCLKLNPFLWSAFESLCELGGPVDVADYFKLAIDGSASKKLKLNVADSRQAASDLEGKIVDEIEARENLAKSRRDGKYHGTLPLGVAGRAKVSGLTGAQTHNTAPLSSVANVEQNTRALAPVTHPVSSDLAQEQAQPVTANVAAKPLSGGISRRTNELKYVRKPQKPLVVGRGARGSNVPAATKPGPASSLPLNVREKKRPRVNSATTKSTGVVAAGEGKSDTVPAGASRTPPPNDEAWAVTYLMDLLHILGVGYANMCQYRCAKAIDVYGELPPAQHNTGYVLTQIGIAYFEMRQFAPAEVVFKYARELEPHRKEGMEIYATLLYELHKDVALSNLAHQLVDLDRRSPEAWLAVGNSFGLQKDHQRAIRCFQRAMQLEPSFAYAYTLCGHEYFESEEYEKAQTYYRNALRMDRRHYKAWYGLGMVNTSYGKEQMAEYHFQKAVEINPSNLAMLCALAAAQERTNKTEESFKTIGLASRLNGNDVHVRIRKAMVYMKLEDYDSALKLLESVKECASKEGQAAYMMGRIYVHLGERGKALAQFTAAASTEGKMAHVSREAIEKLDISQEEAEKSPTKGSIWEDVYKTIS